MNMRTAIVAASAFIAALSMTSCASLGAQEDDKGIYWGMSEEEFKERYGNYAEKGSTFKDKHAWLLPHAEDSTKRFFFNDKHSVAFTFYDGEGLRRIQMSPGVSYEEAKAILMNRYPSRGNTGDKCAPFDIMCTRIAEFTDHSFDAAIVIQEFPGKLVRITWWPLRTKAGS